MLGIAWIGMVVALVAGQAGPANTAPAYVREGDRVEQDFRTYREKLDQFYEMLRSTIERDVPALLPELQGAPPQPVIYGYQMLPRIVENAPLDRKPVASFSYSWPITQGYIDGEGIKLGRLQDLTPQALKATGVAKSALLLSLVHSYMELVGNQRVIDQYIQYNRLWQRTIAENRTRYDQMTNLYRLMQGADPDITAAIREMLGTPVVPSCIKAIVDEKKHTVVLHVPLYTDIESDSFLALAKKTIEDVWKARDADTSYSVEIEVRKISTAALYKNQLAPRPGDHIDMGAHAAHFPSDGVVLTTGAEITNAVVKGYIALGPGDISARTLAHEFGHLLGFPDGYIRGYKDLGEKGFEIQELTSVFSDIMSAPREGSVQPAHFKLVLESLNSSDRTVNN